LRRYPAAPGGERAGNAEVERIEFAGADRQTDSGEKQETEQTAAQDLAAGSKQDDLAGTDDLLQVDLEPDHEQHEDQAEFGDEADRFLGFDPAHAEWTNDESGDKVGEDQGLSGKMS
jgi:hypothetical protein